MFYAEGGEVLGVYLDGRGLETRNTAKRFGRLRKALSAALRMRKVSGWAIEVLVGHAAFYGLVSQEILSVFHSMYPFI